MTVCRPRKIGNEMFSMSSPEAMSSVWPRAFVESWRGSARVHLCNEQPNTYTSQKNDKLVRTIKFSRADSRMRGPRITRGGGCSAEAKRRNRLSCKGVLARVAGVAQPNRTKLVGKPKRQLKHTFLKEAIWLRPNTHFANPCGGRHTDLYVFR